jgi:hypothetical protein
VTFALEKYIPFSMLHFMNPKRKIYWLTACATIVLAISIGSCKKDKQIPIQGVCPEVTSTSPTNLEVNVPVNQVITATFNEAMDPATINTSTFIVSGSVVLGTVSYSGTTAKFTPSSPLTPNHTYIAKITTGARDLMGLAVQTDYVWTFSTGPTLTPAVIATDPVSNATGIFLNKIVSATFSTPMNPLTLTTATFTVKQAGTAIAGTVSYSNEAAYFTPTSALTSNTLYSATITTGAKNPGGTGLTTNYDWSFTTGAVTAPVVTSTDPAGGSLNVPLTKLITATFSEPMDPSTINSSTFTLKLGTTPVAGAITYSGSTATFTPSVNLLSSTTYTATISYGAKNMSGVTIANIYSWNFNTVSTLGGPNVDLKTVSRFGIIAGVGISNDAGFSIINDLDVGISPGLRSSITGFPPAVIINGAIYASDDISPPGIAAMLIQAKQDLTDAYLFAEGAVSPAPATVSGDQGGKTLAPGIYKSTSTLSVQAGDLTLDAQGDANAVWIFQVQSAFTTVGGAGGNIILINGAQAKNIYWQTGSSATIGNNTSFKGNVLALSSITMGAYATATGRMLARNGSVVLTSTNIINKP